MERQDDVLAGCPDFISDARIRPVSRRSRTGEISHHRMHGKRIHDTAMTQFTMFAPEQSEAKKYSAKIEAPIYEPKNQQPHVVTLCNDGKTRELLREIDDSSLPDAEKAFLRAAAHRHSVFNYERCADYYAHATPEMQRLMERSALVIIDFNAAIENGFVRLCDEIKGQFLEEYSDGKAT